MKPFQPTRAFRARVASAVALAAACTLLPAPAHAATLVAQYGFDNSLASALLGASDLLKVDPLDRSGFVTDTVFGTERTVYEFNGLRHSDYQGGLRFDSAGLLQNDSYSVAMTFQFFDLENAWRRIIDTSGRTSDSGFYVNSGNMLAVYPASGSNVAFNNNEYHNVVLTVGTGGNVSAYIDGGESFSTISTDLNISSTGWINLFLDDRLRPQEWSAGRIASLSFYDGVLTPEQVAAIHDNPFGPVTAVPEPATWAMLIGGFGLVGLSIRRRNSMTPARLS